MLKCRDHVGAWTVHPVVLEPGLAVAIENLGGQGTSLVQRRSQASTSVPRTCVFTLCWARIWRRSIRTSRRRCILLDRPSLHTFN